MSSLRVRAPLAALLPDPGEVGPPAAREPGLPEEARLAPLMPMPRLARSWSHVQAGTNVASPSSRTISRTTVPSIGSTAGASPPDARSRALLQATAARLADLESLSRALRPDLAAVLGDRRGAIAELARELRSYLEAYGTLDRSRGAARPV